MGGLGSHEEMFVSGVDVRDKLDASNDLFSIKINLVKKGQRIVVSNETLFGVLSNIGGGLYILLIIFSALAGGLLKFNFLQKLFFQTFLLKNLM